MKVTYGDFTYDSEAFPAASTAALLSRGLAHFLGNEVSARVGASFKKDAIEAHKSQNGVTEVDKAMRASLEANAIPDTESATYVERKRAILGEFVEMLRAGTVGIRERGAAVDPFEAEVAAITKARVVAILRAERKNSAGEVYKIWSERRDPKVDDAIVLADKTMTFADALASHGAKHREAIEREARKRLAEREAAKAKVAKSDLDEAF